VSAAETAEPDRVEGAPHPRDASALFGQDGAEASFVDAWAGGRLHHAWLLRGPRGVGKATLAYRIARALLAAPAGEPPPPALGVDPGHPVARRIAAGAEPRLRVVRRPADPKTGRLRTAITVDEVRRLRDLFTLSAADGGWRVAIVDAADEMNDAAANALLKILEEPPPKALLLLVAHAPGRLLPTIRSRCRTLDLGPLGAADLARALVAAGAEAPSDAAMLAALSGGAPGEALRLIAEDGVALYGRLAALLGGAPGLDRGALIRLGDEAAGRAAQPRYDMILRLTETLLQRLARAGAAGAAGAAGPGALLGEAEARLAARL